MPKRLAELFILVGYLVLAVLLYRSTAGYPESVQGSTAMYVRFLGMALGILCTFELFLWIQKRGQVKAENLNITPAPLRFWGLLILLIIYSALQSIFGFYLTSALYLPLGMLLLGERKPLRITLTSAGTLLFVYLVFAKLLEVPLPEGSLFY
jgi:putative tricarboxylic transport membrane protein